MKTLDRLSALGLRVSVRLGLIRLRQRLSRAAEPQVFFPGVATLMLAVVWGTTMNLIEVERGSAERAMTASAVELLDTYEAHVLRNLREIDQTLKVVKFAYQASGSREVLLDLREKGLLPPELVFAISIADRNGSVVASTRPVDLVSIVVDLYQHHLQRDELRISLPRQDVRSGEWKLDFSRPFVTRDRRFAGIVTLSVDAAYFVSDYDRNKLGMRGLLGLVGSDDGVFRVRRTGEQVTSGDAVTHAAFDARKSEETILHRGQDAWDSVVRLSTLRNIHSFPLALVVGLSSDEQLASAQKNERAYVLRAGVASVLLLLIIGGVGRMSWKLSQTARRENEARLAHAERIQDLAYHDALTSLPNRALFTKTLEQAISQARRYRRKLAVLFLDLDRFKQINDTLGHQAGDRFLQEAATRLRHACARATPSPVSAATSSSCSFRSARAQVVSAVAQKLLSEIAQPVPLMGQSVIGTASIGIAVYPRDGHDEQTLMKYADAAMYHAKDQGKNNYQYLLEPPAGERAEQTEDRDQPASGARARRARASLPAEGRSCHESRHGHGGAPALGKPRAWARTAGRFHTHRRRDGAHRPHRRWALETACVQNAIWQKQGLPRVCIAVNLSARQFDDERLLEDVRGILRETGLDPRLLELEITESMLMNNVEKAIRTLSALSAMQVRLALDDFGTGYSSLSNLKRFPLNTLKIDRSFVSELPNDVEDRVITNAIVGMAKALSLNVVAEGVETKAQADYLREQGCDEYQGYYFSKPVPADELSRLLRAQPAFAMTTQPVRRSLRQPVLRRANARHEDKQQRKP